MEPLSENWDTVCPSDEIAAYIDGEICLTRELELELHFSGCGVCAQELNQQKQFLCGLDSSLKHEGGLELPADFTKRIVANAESTVSGLRRPKERFNALFISAGLFLFVLFALGTDAVNVLTGVSTIYEQIAAVGGFFGHLIYSVFLGVAIVARSLAAQFRIDAVVAVVVTVIFAILLMVISRRVVRTSRA